MAETPVILIHGVGSSFEHNWRQPGWVDLLSELGRPVVAVELPGHGANRIAPEHDAAELITEQAAAHGSVDAVGFSAGGYALLAAASRAPSLFRRIAVLGVADSGLVANPAALDGIAAGLLSQEEPSDAMTLVIRRLVQSAGNDPAAVARFLRSRQARAGLGDLAAITAAALVVEGTEDRSGPAMALAEAIPGAQRLQLKGADHFAIPSDFRCMDAVLSFLAQ
jgi:pimeloyl-ACP methyl ester carboxylesterase